MEWFNANLNEHALSIGNECVGLRGYTCDCMLFPIPETCVYAMHRNERTKNRNILRFIILSAVSMGFWFLGFLIRRRNETLHFEWYISEVGNPLSYHSISKCGTSNDVVADQGLDPKPICIEIRKLDRRLDADMGIGRFAVR